MRTGLARDCDLCVIAPFAPRPYMRSVRQHQSPQMQRTVPVIVALIVVVLGQAVILVGDFRPSNPSVAAA
jgi:hypothetical protein